MAPNLLEMAQGALTPALVETASVWLGETPRATRRGLEGALPGVLALLVRQGTRLEGAGQLRQELESGGAAAPLPSPGTPEGLEHASALGAAMLGRLLGPRPGSAVESLARTAGLRPENAAALEGLAAALLAGLLEREVRQRHLEGPGLVQLLDAQRAHVAGAGGPSLPPAVLAAEEGAQVTPLFARARAAHPPDSPRLGWVAPVLLLSLLVLGVAGGWGLLGRGKAPRGGSEPGLGGAGTAGLAETYRCEDGRTVALVGLGNNRVQLRWGDTQQVLTRVRTGSGERYSNDDYAWHSHGEQAVLFRGLQRLGRCHLSGSGGRAVP